MVRNNKFTDVLDKIDGQLKMMQVRAAMVRFYYESDELLLAYEQALRLEEHSEKCVLQTRNLPVYTGVRDACEAVSGIVCNCIGAKIGFTEEGWFYLAIPMLLPKKESGSAEYIRSALYPAMRDYFSHCPPVRFQESVLIFRHVYDKRRPERQWRDHDNIEVNMVSDIVAMYVLADDCPSVCSHYYCSAAGEEDRTTVYVVPKQDFPKWLQEENGG